MSSPRTISDSSLPAARCAEAGCTLAYVNMVGGQDELVFDGDSVVVAADGAVLARAPQFEETCLVVSPSCRRPTRRT